MLKKDYLTISSMKNLKIVVIAKKLNVTHSAVSQWFQGKTRPTLLKAFALEDRFGIPVSAWRDIRSYLKQNINKEAQKPSSAEDRSNRQEAV